MFIVIKKLFNFSILEISITNINIPLSPICLLLTYAVCCEHVNLAELFVVLPKELLISFLDLHLTEK